MVLIGSASASLMMGVIFHLKADATIPAGIVKLAVQQRYQLHSTMLSDSGRQSRRGKDSAFQVCSKIMREIGQGRTQGSKRRTKVTVEPFVVDGFKRYVVRRGAQYFSFFVDHDKCTFSKDFSLAHYFSSRLEAEGIMMQIRERNRVLRLAARGEK